MFCRFFCIFCLYKFFGVTNCTMWTIKHFKILQVTTVVAGFVCRCSLLFSTFFFFHFLSVFLNVACQRFTTSTINQNRHWLNWIKFAKSRFTIIIESFIDAMRMLSNYWKRFLSNWHTPFDLNSFLTNIKWGR